MEVEEKAFKLWKLLDDIDTLDDSCRENDELFRKLVYDMQRRRFEIIDIPEINELYEKYY